MKFLKNVVFYISIISLSVVSVVVPFIFTKYNKPSSFNTPVLEVKEKDVDEKYITQYSSDFSKALEQTGLDTGIINEINNIGDFDLNGVENEYDKYLWINQTAIENEIDLIDKIQFSKTLPQIKDSISEDIFSNTKNEYSSLSYAEKKRALDIVDSKLENFNETLFDQDSSINTIDDFTNYIFEDINTEILSHSSSEYSTYALNSLWNNEFSDFINKADITVDTSVVFFNTIFSEENINEYIGKDFSIATTEFLSQYNFFYINNELLNVDLYGNDFSLITSIKNFDEGNYIDGQHNNYYEYDFEVAFAISKDDWISEKSEYHKIQLLPESSFDMNNSKTLFEQLDYSINNDFNIDLIDEYFSNSSDLKYNKYSVDGNTFFESNELSISNALLLDKNINYRDNIGDGYQKYVNGQHSVWDEKKGDWADYYYRLKICLPKLKFKFEVDNKFVNSDIISSIDAPLSGLIEEGAIKNFQVSFFTEAHKFWIKQKWEFWKGLKWHKKGEGVEYDKKWSQWFNYGSTINIDAMSDVKVEYGEHKDHPSVSKATISIKDKFWSTIRLDIINNKLESVYDVMIKIDDLTPKQVTTNFFVHSNVIDLKLSTPTTNSLPIKYTLDRIADAIPLSLFPNLITFKKKSSRDDFAEYDDTLIPGHSISIRIRDKFANNGGGGEILAENEVTGRAYHLEFDFVVSNTILNNPANDWISQPTISKLPFASNSDAIFLDNTKEYRNWLTRQVDSGLSRIDKTMSQQVNLNYTNEEVEKAIRVHKEALKYYSTMNGLTIADLVVNSLSIALIWPTLGATFVDVVFTTLSISVDVLNLIEYDSQIKYSNEVIEVAKKLAVDEDYNNLLELNKLLENYDEFAKDPFKIINDEVFRRLLAKASDGFSSNEMYDFHSPITSLEKVVSVVSIFAVYGLTKFIEWIAYDKASSILFSFANIGYGIRNISKILTEKYSQASWLNKSSQFAKSVKLTFGALSVIIVTTKLIVQMTWGDFILNRLKGLKI
ncbi:MAG: hypothetical protein Ta2E_06150 [Mycoplasmoidaceae bacterium]|nr:MAG: hypothetical protein Ta2E_06150 [Mycoplasmoidaceae bacterium]